MSSTNHAFDRKTFEKMLDIEFNKLQHIQDELLKQHRISPNQVIELNYFVREVLRVMEKEIPRLHTNNLPNSPSTFDSGSPSTSPVSDQPSPITPSSTPPHRNEGDQAFVVELQAEEASFSRRKVSRRRKTRSEPPVSIIVLTISRIFNNLSQQHILSLSPSSSLRSSIAEVEIQNEESSEGIHEEEQEKEGTYMQIPPFGPPELRPHPRVGRRSPNYSNPSVADMTQKKDSLQ